MALRMTDRHPYPYMRKRAVSDSFIHGIPKAELHVHLEGTLEPGMLLNLADRNSIRLPWRTEEDVKSAQGAVVSLDTFLDFYMSTLSVFLHWQDYYDITSAFLETSASNNVAYVEIMVDAQAHTQRGIEFSIVADAMHQASADAEAKLGIRSRFILCLWRELSAEEGMKALDAALPYRDIIIGVGLDNMEVTDFPLKFVDLFRRARAEGFHLTAHCDVGQPNALQHIRQCIEQLEVDRIDHGVDSLRDPGLIELIKARDICLTVCPTMTYAMKEPRRVHAVLEMLDRGMNVTANSDDPGIDCSRYMNDILSGLCATGRFIQEDVVQLMHNAFRSAWIDESTRKKYLTRLSNYVGVETS